MKDDSFSKIYKMINCLSLQVRDYAHLTPLPLFHYFPHKNKRILSLFYALNLNFILHALTPPSQLPVLLNSIIVS